MSINNNQPRSPLEYPANDNVPVRIFRRNRAPLTTDFRNFRVRDFWNDTSLNDLWYLTSKTPTSALWVKLGGSSSGDVQFLAGDSGGDVPPDGSGVINVLGGPNVSTVGDIGTNTITWNIDRFITGDSGGNVPADGSGVINIVGGTNVTTTGDIGTNTLTIDATGGDVFLAGDSGGNVPPDGSGVFNVLGGTGVTTVGDIGTNTVTWNVTGGGLDWIEVTVTGPTTLAANTGYVTNNAATVNLTLPATIPFGSVIRICGKGAGGWSLGQNAGQTIQFGNVATTTGAGGSIASTQQNDCLELVCITADTDFNVLSSVGVLTVT